MPAVDTQRGRSAPPRRGPKRKPVLRIADVVAKTQRDWERTEHRPAPRLATPGLTAPTYARRTVARKQAQVAHKQRVAEHEHDLRVARHQAVAQERAIRSLAESVRSQGTLQRAVREQAGRSQKRTEVEKHPGLWGLIAKGGTQRYRGAGLGTPGVRAKGMPEHRVSGRTPAELRKELAFFGLSPRSQQKIDWQKFTAKGHARQAGATRLVTAGLEEASRPLYAVSGATRAAVKGENVAKAAERGIKKQDKFTVSDVLDAAGWKPKGELGKIARGVVAFGGDVVLDPVTWASGGTSTIARSAAKSAAKSAARKEGARVYRLQLSKGFSRASAKNTAKRAADKAANKVFDAAEAVPVKAGTRGAEVRFAGKRIGGRHQVRATAAVGRKIKQGGAAAAKTKPGARVAQTSLKARDFAAALNARVRPPGMTPEQFRRVQQIDRERRAAVSSSDRRAAARGRSIGALVRPEEHEAFRAATEAADLSSLANAPKVKLRLRDVLKNRKQIKAELAENPARLQRLAAETTAERAAQRERLLDLGVPVGHVGAKPPLTVPAITADPTAARKLAKSAKGKVTTAKRQRLAATRDIERLQTEAAKLSAAARAAKTPQATQRLRLRSQNIGRKVVAARQRIAELDEFIKSAPHKAPKRAAKAEGRALKVQTKAAEKAEKINARRAGEAQGYFPRVLKSQVEARGETTLEDIVSQQPRRTATGSKKPSPSFAKPRRNREAIEKLRQSKDWMDRDYAEQFSADPSLVHSAYMRAGGRAEAKAVANRQLIAEGAPVQHGQPLKLNEGERVYEHDGPNIINELDPATIEGKATMQAIEAGKAEGRNYVVLPKAMHDYMLAGADLQPGKVGAAWTHVFGRWKGIALKTPATMMRNLTGDMFNAMGAQSPHRLAKNWMRGQQALGARQRSADAYKWFADEAAKAGKGKSTMIRGRNWTYEQLAALAEATGAIQVNRLGDVAETQAGFKRTLQRPQDQSQAMHRIGDRVENSARMATFIGQLEKGLTPERAADVVRDMHFDYGELTRFEKKLRNYALPFYTFSARNIPLQAKLLYQRPGLAASVGHAREEGRKSSGLPEDFWKGLNPYEAKQLGVPIKWNGHTYTVSTGAPITDLSALTPADGSLKSWLTLPAAAPGTRGLELMGPYKIVGELLTNHSLFYGEPIKPDPRSGVANLTPVNGWVAKMADQLPGLAKRFGIIKALDNVSGEMVWQWGREKEAALNAALPGPLGAATRVSRSATSPRGFNVATEALGSLAGVRARPYDPAQNQLTVLNDELEQKVLPAINILHDQAHYKGYHPTPELLRLQAREAEINKLMKDIQRGRLRFFEGKPNDPTKKKQATGGVATGGGFATGGGIATGGGVATGGGFATR